MDRNTVVGFLLIFALLLVWTQLTGPTQADILEQQRVQDSLAKAEAGPAIQGANTNQLTSPSLTDTSSAGRAVVNAQYGVFAPNPAAAATTTTHVLENEVLKLTFSSRGGRITSAELKQYNKISAGEADEVVTAPVVLLKDAANEWSLSLPATGAAGGMMNTSQLPAEVQQEGNTITFRMPATTGGALVQRYTLGDDYRISYEVFADNLSGAIGSTATAELRWINLLDKVEKNVAYEQQYSMQYWREVDEKVDYVSASGDDAETAGGATLWVSHAQQFFNTSLVATANPLTDVVMKSSELPDESENLKRLETTATIALGSANQPASYTLFVGPNKFEALRETAEDLEDIIPFGWSLFGTINRWVVRPVFSFLSSVIGSAGIVILVLTLIIKLALYPLTYKMLYSQAKMSALKPRLAKMKDKFKDDAQAQQMETMKLYREYGVNPAGGCLPMLLQMPIWFALYRFFPASIEFRQESFLWATDLSSYDEWIHFGFNLWPLGDHLSLFTLLWVVTTLAYTYYNSQAMDMGQLANNPALKYMQYLMPVMFLFFFNNFASGLTVYLVFSNLVNIAQTLITKNVIINHEKIELELNKAKEKPKKTSGFGARLENALKEQQRIAAERSKK